MILHRFCSLKEYDKYKSGETLRNTKDHFAGGRGGSLSIGFCFFSGNPDEWAHRLNGIADFDILLTVDVDSTLVRQTVGVYADWSTDDGYSLPHRKKFIEFCTTEYDEIRFRFVGEDRSFAKKFVSHRDIPLFLQTQRQLRTNLTIDRFPLTVEK